MASNLRALRLALVDAEREVRNARDSHESVSAICTHEGISSGAVTGKNAEERKTTLGVYLATHVSYQASLAILRDAEWQCERTAALLEAAKDERRAAEWQIRCRLADALFSHAVQSDADQPASDSAFDDATDYEAMRNFSGSVNHLDDGDLLFF